MGVLSPSPREELTRQLVSMRKQRELSIDALCAGLTHIDVLTSRIDDLLEQLGRLAR